MSTRAADVARLRAMLTSQPDDRVSWHNLRQAAHLCTETGDAARALSFSMRAVQLALGDVGAQISLCESLLAAGQLAEAEAKAAALCTDSPTNQHSVEFATAVAAMKCTRFGGRAGIPKREPFERWRASLDRS